MKKILLTVLTFVTAMSVWSKEYHVSSAKGDDKGDGSVSAPFKTINAASAVALPGDVITVHEGTYREWIDPQRGGESDSKRIVYRAADGENVFIKGSEVLKGWKKQKDGTWMIRLEDDFFGGYNSFKTDLEGDWLWEYPHQKGNHTADIYLNGKSLFEADSLNIVVSGRRSPGAQDSVASAYRWYCANDDKGTTIWANFHEADPNKELVEASVRPTCVYSTKQGINYITVSGFDISQAASQWGAPTAEQIGMVATHWNKGWIIENNIIHDTKSSGITLGKERSTGHNVWSNHPSKDGSLHYIETTFRAIEHGWDKKNVGSHIVRNNVIYNCEQTGMCGSMGCSFSQISNNHIYDIWVKRQFTGAEIGGIKFHAAIDTYLHNNHIHNTGRAIWLDWMTQGTRVSSNLLYDNDLEDIFVEVNHGPFVVDNNICLSPNSLRNQSQGGAYIHNLFAGELFSWPEHMRYTPYHHSQSTRVKGVSVIPGGDDFFFNNIFIPAHKINKDRIGLEIYNVTKFPFPLAAEGNVYYNGAKPYRAEKTYLGRNDREFKVSLSKEADGMYLNVDTESLDNLANRIVTSDILGVTKVSEEKFLNMDGTPIVIDHDYFGKKRSVSPSAGPFEKPQSGALKLKVW